ncbi:uncharacterized protein STAUR_0332 [Stigmatella aurantiaca DW4/3-1]|uniref:Uncharacterized protein n=2 Tax=Stigmatella aurantiaca TaxID=41 RepID=E3FNR2_STIAD|nr:uncharacterized protein STAUR_0332 [Stigmatella aurantiaca DW4/3-1]
MVNLGQFIPYEFVDESARAALPTAGFDRISLRAMELLINVKAATLIPAGLFYGVVLGIGPRWGLPGGCSRGWGCSPRSSRSATGGGALPLRSGGVTVALADVWRLAAHAGAAPGEHGVLIALKSINSRLARV